MDDCEQRERVFGWPKGRGMCSERVRVFFCLKMVVGSSKRTSMHKKPMWGIILIQTLFTSFFHNK